MGILRRLAERLTKEHFELPRPPAFLGDAYKQVFFDADDKASPSARDALKRGIATYRKPFEDNPAATLPGPEDAEVVVRRGRPGAGLFGGPDSGSSPALEHMARVYVIALSGGRDDPAFLFQNNELREGGTAGKPQIKASAASATGRRPRQAAPAARLVGCGEVRLPRCVLAAPRAFRLRWPTMFTSPR